MRRTRRWLAGAVVAAALALGAARAEDRHTGYYYPPPGSAEVYESRAIALPDSDRARRLGFVTLMTGELLSQPYAPDYAVFAKGEEAEKLIIVGLQDGRLNTIFRARALFATLTAVARATDLFKDYRVQDVFTFFDLLKLLGFTQVTITDGVAFAHQVVIR